MEKFCSEYRCCSGISQSAAGMIFSGIVHLGIPFSDVLPSTSVYLAYEGGPVDPRQYMFRRSSPVCADGASFWRICRSQSGLIYSAILRFKFGGGVGIATNPSCSLVANPFAAFCLGITGVICNLVASALLWPVFTKYCPLP